MMTSLREVFSHQGIANEVISVRHQLANHRNVQDVGLGQLCRRFLTPASANGWSRGCQRELDVRLFPIPIRLPDVGEIAFVIPSWVPVDATETRTLEGVLAVSKISNTDFPLKPWHWYYDWNFIVRIDRQYTYLHGTNWEFQNDPGRLIECEWDTAFLPDWAWPQTGDRVWMCGRWIYDCGHPGPEGHKTELHPVKAVVSFRSEPAPLPGNTGPTRATKATVFIGKRGGYWDQPINDQDYAFNLYLPPKPYPEATPTWRINPVSGSVPLTVSIVPTPTDNPRYLRVTIPLKGVTPEPEQWGGWIWAGWSDPRRTESAHIRRVRVRMQEINMRADYDVNNPDEWYVYVGINGRWEHWENLHDWWAPLGFTVDLELHDSDQIHITACGFEADPIHDYMGHDSGYNWAQISSATDAERVEIGRKLISLLWKSFNQENNKISYLNVCHPALARGTFLTPSDIDDYRLRYTISDPPSGGDEPRPGPKPPPGGQIP